MAKVKMVKIIVGYALSKKKKVGYAECMN